MSSGGDVAAVEAWLRSQRSTLFGQAFDISQSTRPAAEWFVAQVEDFIQHAEATQRIRQKYPKFPPITLTQELWGAGTTPHTVDL